MRVLKTSLMHAHRRKCGLGNRLSAKSSAQNGFSLIEIAIVLIVLALLFALFAGMSTNLISQHRRELTKTRLANIDAALTLFVSQYKRLPCPADGRKDPVVDPTAGQENPPTPPSNCGPNTQQFGVVPWSALGLAAGDIEDGWGGRFTYRVGPELVVSNAMDFSSCDPAGTNLIVFFSPTSYCKPAGALATDCNGANLSNCTPPNTALAGAAGKGLVVENVAGAILMDPRANPSTGAAYVVISHGADGGGAYSSQGVAQVSGTAPGTMEAMNFPNLAYTPPPLAGAPTSFLVDDAFNGTVVSHFDDFVSRPNILTVATKAQLGPRAH